MDAPQDGESPAGGEASDASRSQTDTSHDADVRAFLIADVRGYTAFTQEHSGRLEDLFVRCAAQVHTSPQAAIYFAVLDARVPPFDDVNVRRAMNLALDRDRIVKIFGGEATARATCQQLPPNFPGYAPYCPYTLNPGPEEEGSWSGPDMEEARRLVRRSGTAGTRIEFQMAFDAWFVDYPAASNFITNRFTCDTSWVPSARFCNRRIDAMINRAVQTQIDDPVAAGALWAEIDRAIVDQAPYVWLVNPIVVEFVSERVGNYQYSQQWGTLLDQLWVQ